MTLETAGVVLAGGRSTRMGVDKALAPLAGRPLVAHVAARFAPQVDALFLNANGDAARFASLRCAIVADAAPNARMRSAPPATIVPAIATVSLGFRMSVSCSGFCGDALLSSELQD